MAYTGFPATYQQMYNPYQQQQANYSQNGIIWVQGEAGAKSYLVAPNTTVQLWDSEEKRIYLKSADASGMPSIRTLEYTIVGEDNRNTPLQAGNYATHKDIEDLQRQIENLRSQIEVKHEPTVQPVEPVTRK